MLGQLQAVLLADTAEGPVVREQRDPLQLATGATGRQLPGAHLVEHVTHLVELAAEHVVHLDQVLADAAAQRRHRDVVEVRRLRTHGIGQRWIDHVHQHANRRGGKCGGTVGVGRRRAPRG